MKKIHNILLFFFALAVVFTGCEKDDAEPVLDTAATVNPAWVKAPAADTHFILTQDSADVVLAEFQWTDVVYALDDLPSPLYTMRFAFPAQVDGNSAWGETIELFTLPETNTSITQGALNTAILKIIGTDFPEDTVITIGFSVKANVNANSVSNVIDAFTEVVPVKITPYTASLDAAKLWMPGDYQGWDPASAPNLYDWDGDGIFTGYLYMSADAASFQFKFTSDPSWDGINYGAAEAEGVLDPDGGAGNLELPAAGGYQITVDLNTLTWSYVAEDWGVIGQWLDWAEDINMEWDAENNWLHVIVADIPAQEDQRFKFRANDGWDINLGISDPDDGFLVPGGDDIPIPDGGTYEFILDFNTQLPSYQAIKQ